MSGYSAKTYDAIIVGGGIIGSAAAYYLSARCFRTLVIERGDQASGTAGASDGVVGYHTKKPGAHMDFAVYSIAMFPGLSEELGADVEYDGNCGGMLLIEDAEQWAYMEALAAEQRAGGVDIRLVGIREARELEPQLSPDLMGVLYSPASGKVNPLKLTFAYASAARRAGAVFLNGTNAAGILMESDRVVGVRTPAGDFYGGRVVVAAGSWSSEIAASAGFYAPVRPRKGQILVTEPMGPFIKGTAQCARYYIIKNRPESVPDERESRTGASFSIAQSDDGAILIGSTREDAGYDRENTLEAFEFIMARAARFYPSLKNARVIRSFAGLRPYTPDGLPMIGKAGPTRGLYVAAGHEGDGIALAPATGKSIAEIVAQDAETSFPLDAFNPNRFIKNNRPGGAGR